MDASGGLLRSQDGKPILRPGGHGALIDNLNDLQGDLIFIKNIDNVRYNPKSEVSTTWIQALGGYLVRLQGKIHQFVQALQRDELRDIGLARDFAKQALPGVTFPATADSATMRDAILRRLQRPLRICGMVRNEGEPGGGPFWLRQADGTLSPQIVETAEIDLGDSAQRAIVQQATHFNPVFMALAVRDYTGEPYDLRRYVNRRRSIITQKPVGGKMANVLERPGLWNGGMAKWNSVFVEVPKEVFSPVKTVFDLLREEHQPAFHQTSIG
jgi:hypothetical protein